MRKIQSIAAAVVFFCAFTVLTANAQNIDNVVIVLDASGSMNDMLGNVKKIDAAKTAMKEVIKTLPQSTHVGLLVFSASNVRDWAYPLGPRDEQKLNAAIDLPQPSGNTPLGTYMKMGTDRLLEARKTQFGYGTYRLLVVTDGEANTERKGLVDLYTRDIISRGITVDVIGVRMNKAHTLATKVHSYRSANDPAALQKAIREVFAEVTQPKDNATADEIFAEIAPLPDEIVPEIINAFSSSGNHPIGTQPAPAKTAQAGADQAAPPPAPPASPPAQPKKKSNSSIGIIALIIAAIAAVASTRKRARN